MNEHICTRTHNTYTHTHEHKTHTHIHTHTHAYIHNREQQLHNMEGAHLNS